MVNVHPSLTCELAHQAFARAHIAQDATASNTLQHVFAIPSDEMPIVDDVLLSLAKLTTVVSEPCNHRTFTPVRLTSFRMIAPMLMIQQIPTPPILYTNMPSPENIAFPNPCAL